MHYMAQSYTISTPVLMTPVYIYANKTRLVANWLYTHFGRYRINLPNFFPIDFVCNQKLHSIWGLIRVYKSLQIPYPNLSEVIVGILYSI